MKDDLNCMAEKVKIEDQVSFRSAVARWWISHTGAFHPDIWQSLSRGTLDCGKLVEEQILLVVPALILDNYLVGCHLEMIA